MHILTVRHLEDENAIKSFGLDAPLKSGQEDRAAEIAREIEDFARFRGLSRVLVLCSNRRRSQDTASMVVAELVGRIPVSVRIETGLAELDQGQPHLPADYQDGEKIPTFDEAWDAFCAETYTDRNVGYKFGTNADFARVGEALEDLVPRLYRFFERLLSGSLADEDELLVLCTHSTTIYTLLELAEVANDIIGKRLDLHSPEELPFLCWQYFKERVEPLFPDDLAFGQVVPVDLDVLSSPEMIETLVQTRKVFEERKMISSNSIQGKINSSSNDYSGLDRHFQAITGQTLDASESLLAATGFAPISVVVPYYKSGSTIIKLLDAIEGQDLSPDEMRQVEVVIVDDGSKDNLSELLQDRQFSFELTVVTLKQNSGRSAARNAGAEAAKHNVLMFLDSDILLTRHCLREHALRNSLVPGHLYTSLIDNISSVSEEMKAGLENRTGLPEPAVYREYRTEEFVPAGQMGLYPAPQDCTIRIMDETDNFRSFGFGRRVSIYDLPCMFATYVVSLDKQLFQQIGGFSLEFKGWGMEDTYFGAVEIALGAKVVPVLSAGGYHVAHTPRSGSNGAWAREFQKNIDQYKKMISLPF